MPIVLADETACAKQWVPWSDVSSFGKVRAGHRYPVPTPWNTWDAVPSPLSRPNYPTQCLSLHPRSTLKARASPTRRGTSEPIQHKLFQPPHGKRGDSTHYQFSAVSFKSRVFPPRYLHIAHPILQLMLSPPNTCLVLVMTLENSRSFIGGSMARSNSELVQGLIMAGTSVMFFLDLTVFPTCAI